MRWLYNFLLVVFMLPLLRASFMLIGLLFFNFGGEKSPSNLLIIPVWTIFLIAFAFVYKKRAGWLESAGVYQSWSNPEAYVNERHRWPELPIYVKREFLVWAGLTQTPPRDLRSRDFRKITKGIHEKIQAEIQATDKKVTYVKCLIWYTTGHPIKEGFYEAYEASTSFLNSGLGTQLG